MEQNSLQQVSRRNFMKGALVAGAATAAMGLAACSPSSPSDTGNLADTALLIRRLGSGSRHRHRGWWHRRLVRRAGRCGSRRLLTQSRGR